MRTLNITTAFFATKHETLDEIEKTLCEQEVTVVECHESLIEFPDNKCPGSDGLTVDFYKFFWDKIKSFLMDSYNYSFENNLLSLDQRRAILVLIPKGTKDKRELKNWRPISLLNVDYKILAKVPDKRLQQVIAENYKSRSSRLHKRKIHRRQHKNNARYIGYHKKQN